MPEKKCFKCEIVKDLSEFYVHPQMGDGHLNKCKECTKKDTLLRSLLSPEYIKAYEKKRNATEERKLKRKQRYAENKKNKPHKYVARYLLSNAIRDNRITRSLKCELCGIECLTEGHHLDYLKPLEVLWLCKKCHRQIHIGENYL